MNRFTHIVMAAMALALSVASNAFAGTTVPVPEISPTSLSAGLATLAGGVLMLRARRRK